MTHSFKDIRHGSSTHRVRSGIDTPYSVTSGIPKAPRTAGMRAKTDTKILPMYETTTLFQRLFGC